MHCGLHPGFISTCNCTGSSLKSVGACNQCHTDKSSMLLPQALEDILFRCVVLKPGRHLLTHGVACGKGLDAELSCQNHAWRTTAERQLTLLASCRCQHKPSGITVSATNSKKDKFASNSKPKINSEKGTLANWGLLVEKLKQGPDRLIFSPLLNVGLVGRQGAFNQEDKGAYLIQLRRSPSVGLFSTSG